MESGYKVCISGEADGAGRPLPWDDGARTVARKLGLPYSFARSSSFGGAAGATIASDRSLETEGIVEAGMVTVALKRSLSLALAAR